MSALRRALLLSALALLQGCSSVRLAYDNADTFIRWRANHYFDFQGEASEVLDRRTAAFVAWHRATELPQYAKLAEDAAVRVERGLTREDVDRIYAAIETQIRESVRTGAVQAAALLDRLEPGQIAHFERRLDEENRKFAKENLQAGADDRRKRRLKRTVERLEDWVGTLSEEQLRRVRSYNERAPMLSEMRDRDRKRLQAELISMLRSREAGRRLPDWAAGWDRNRDPAHAAAFMKMRSEYADLLLELYQTLSAEQRRNAVERLRGYGADFAHLARR